MIPNLDLVFTPQSDCEKQLQLVEHRGNEQIEKLKRKTMHLEDKLSKKENDLHRKQVCILHDYSPVCVQSNTSSYRER